MNTTDKIDKIYHYIEEKYGRREIWISDIARKLGISKGEANALTITAGYSRGKKDRSVSLEEYRKEAAVIFIVSKIPDTIMESL